MPALLVPWAKVFGIPGSVAGDGSDLDQIEPTLKEARRRLVPQIVQT